MHIQKPTPVISSLGLSFIILCCAGCMTTPNSIVREHGRPDMIYEAAGDMGRYYLGNDTNLEPWQTHREILFYAESDSAYEFDEGWYAGSRPMNDREHKMLSRLQETESE